MKMRSLKSIHSGFMGKQGLLVKWAPLSAKKAWEECLFLGGRFLAHVNGKYFFLSMVMERIIENTGSLWEKSFDDKIMLLFFL